MADYTHIVIKISGNQITIRASKFWYGTCPKGKCLKKFFVKTARSINCHLVSLSALVFV